MEALFFFFASHELCDHQQEIATGENVKEDNRKW